MLKHLKTIGAEIKIDKSVKKFSKNFRISLHSYNNGIVTNEEIILKPRRKGYHFEISTWNDNTKYRKEFWLDAPSLEWLLRQLIDLFHFGSLTITIIQEKADVFLPALINTKSKIQWLIIRGNFQPVSFKLPVSQLKSLLEDVKCDGLWINWEVSLEEKYFGKLKQKRQMNIDKASWLSIDSLLTMECAVFHGSNVKFTASDIKMFVEKWMDGGLEQLELLELAYREGLWNNWDTVLDGLETFEAKEQHVTVIYLETWKEIRRKDGKKKAVVGLKCNHFVMKVL